MTTKHTTKRLTLKEERMIAFASGFGQGLIEVHDEFAHANGHADNADAYLDMATALLVQGLEGADLEVIVHAAMVVLERAQEELRAAIQITAEGVRTTE